MSWSGRQSVSFLKQQLSNGALFSLPATQFQLLSADEEPVLPEDDGADSPDCSKFEIDDALLQACLGADEYTLPDFDSEEFAFCQVVDSRPENRAKVQQGSDGAGSRSAMLVQYFPKATRQQQPGQIGQKTERRFNRAATGLAVEAQCLCNISPKPRGNSSRGRSFLKCDEKTPPQLFCT